MKPISHNQLTNTKYIKPNPISSFFKLNPIPSILNYFLILFNGFLLNGYNIF